MFRRCTMILAILLTLSACAVNEQASPGVVAQSTADPLPSATPDIQASIVAGVRSTAAAAAPSPTSLPTRASQTPTGTPTEPPSPTAVPTVPPVTAAAAEASASDVLTETVNIELVFDASGSMAQDIGGETKIAAARRAMLGVIDTLPDDEPNLNVGFRVYGHKGDNTEAQRELSCQSTELLVPVRGVDKPALSRQTLAFEPTGWTPISLALQRAAEDLTAGERIRNKIIMVTDGEETCGGDPCAVAAALRQSEAEVVIDVIGFGTTPEQDRLLRCIAENSGGTYREADSGEELGRAIDDSVRMTIPELEIPTFEIPTFEIPTFEIPTFEIPTFEIPTFEIPTFEIPFEDFPGGSDRTTTPTPGG